MNIEKKYAYAIIGLIILGLGILIVNAYNPGGTTNPAVFGHSVNEIQGVARSGTLSSCAALKPTGYTDSDYVCGANYANTAGSVVGGIPVNSKSAKYTGNGATGQTITVGFTPTFLIIFNQNNNDYYVGCSIVSATEYFCKWLPGSNRVSELVITPTATGFRLGNGDTHGNANGISYVYFASA